MTGDQAVKVEITGVTYKTFNSTTVTDVLKVIANGQLDGQNYASFAVSDGGTNTIDLQKGADGTYTNAKAITVTLTYADNFTVGGKTAGIQFVGTGYSGSPITTSATTTTAATVTFTIAAGTLTIDPAGTNVASCVVTANA